MAALSQTRIGQSPIGQFLGSRSNALMAFGGNIDGKARSFAEALQPGFKAAIAGRQLDTQAGILAAEQAAREAELSQQSAQQNATVQWIMDRAAQDQRFAPYADMAQRGIPASEWFNEAMGLLAPAGQTEPTDDISEYQFYAQQELQAGRNPVPFNEWMNPTEAPEPGFTQLTPQEIATIPGLDPAKAYQRGPDNRVYEIGGGGVTVNNDMNAGQSTLAGYADRMANAETILSDPEMVRAMTDVGQQIGSSVPGIGNFLTSPQRQQAEQAQRDFINAILRRESGAVISPSEFENARLQYFPQPGDSPEVIEQKKRNRETALAATARGAGSNYVPPTLTPPGVTDPLGIR